LLAYLCLSAEMWTNSEYIVEAGGCGIKPCGSGTKKNPRRPLHHRSDLIYHVKRDDRQEEWGEIDKTMAEDFHFCVCWSTFQIRNSLISTKWKVNKW